MVYFAQVAADAEQLLVERPEERVEQVADAEGHSSDSVKPEHVAVVVGQSVLAVCAEHVELVGGQLAAEPPLQLPAHVACVVKPVQELLGASAVRQLL